MKLKKDFKLSGQERMVKEIEESMSKESVKKELFRKV
jgi:hypothetical protein